jgi:glycosyltransferase involved in cell wall biosynthesis
VHLKLIGAVGRAPALAVRLESLRRTGMVEVEGQVEFEAIPGLMRRADVCIIPRRPLLMNHLAMPQKLVDFMAAGRCIVATDLAPHAAILGESVAGILCPPTAGGIAAGIRGAFDPGRRAELGRRARAYAERHFDHRSQALRVLRFIESLRRA